jgi:hypothetical protein
LDLDAQTQSSYVESMSLKPHGVGV